MNGYERYRRNRTCPCQRCRIGSAWGPAMLITLGVLFLLDNLNVIGFHHSWPVILLTAGGIMLARDNASTAGHIPRYGIWPAPPQPYAAAPPAPDNPQSLQTLDQGK